MGAKSSKIAAAAIYLLLIFSLGTYFMPLLRVAIPGVKDLKWSVADMVRSLPKPSFQKKEEKASSSVELNFQELMQRIFPKGESRKLKVSPQLVFVALMPVALALAYLMVLLGLIAALFRSRFLIRCTSGLAAVFSGYALGAVYVLADYSRARFSLDKVDPLKNPLEFLGKTFAKEIEIRPETALFVLVIFSAALYLFTFFRPRRLY